MRKLLNVFGARRNRMERELERELNHHLSRRRDEIINAGLSESEARQRAGIEFGGVAQVQEEVRDAWLCRWLRDALQDVAYAARILTANSGFTATTVLSLALAIGVNTAVYSILDAALLRPLPVPQPHRLFTLATLQIQEQGKERPLEDPTWSYPVYQQFRAAAGDSARLGLFSSGNLTDIQIPNKDAPIEKAICGFISGDAFDILHVPPALGRTFTSAEDRTPGGHPYVVISYDYWQRRFQGNPGVLGQRIQIGRHGFSIVGIARKGFFGMEPEEFVDIWIPAMMYSKAALNDPTWDWFRIFGRLSPGTTLTQLHVRLDPVFRAYEQELIQRFPMTPAIMQKQYHERPLLIHPAATGASNFQVTFARSLWIILCAGAGVLLIACANIASLLLARGAARSPEIAMRASLGASRSRIIRQLLTESLLLSLTAGGLGWAIAQATAPTLIAMLSQKLHPVRFALSMDTRVLLFCATVSTCAAVVFGLVPAWRTSATKPADALYGVRATAGRLVLGRAFLTVQVAFAFVLILTGAGFLFSLRNLLAVNMGFNPNHLAEIDISTELSDVSQKPEINVFLDQLQRRIAALPGVHGTTIGYTGALFAGRHNSTSVMVPGHTTRQVYTIGASPRYFSTMQIPLLAGREFDPNDRDYHATGPRQQVIDNAVSPRYFGNEDPAMGARPIIVNRAFAQQYYRNENPLGKVFLAGGNIRYEIIGVVGNALYGSLREGPQPIIYFIVRGTNYVALYIRADLDLGSVANVVEREAESMGHGTRVHNAITLDTLIADTLLRERLLAGVGGAFAGLGLMLTGIGLFGLLNYAVTRRTKEIGIRAALGARARSLIVLVFKDLLVPIVGGLTAGFACSLALVRYVQSLLFGIHPIEPAVILTGVAVFLLATLLAGGLPATRAAAIDPMVALRHE